jgi:hypothetical protein
MSEQDTIDWDGDSKFQYQCSVTLAIVLAVVGECTERYKGKS